MAKQRRRPKIPPVRKRAPATQRPVEKKWFPFMNAHAIAFGDISQHISSHKRARLSAELMKAAKSNGAIDFLEKKVTHDAALFVRVVYQLLGKRELTEEYLDMFRAAYRK